MTEETQTEIKKTEDETEMVTETECRGFCGKTVLWMLFVKK